MTASAPSPAPPRLRFDGVPNSQCPKRFKIPLGPPYIFSPLFVKTDPRDSFGQSLAFLKDPPVYYVFFDLFDRGSSSHILVAQIFILSPPEFKSPEVEWMSHIPFERRCKLGFRLSIPLFSVLFLRYLSLESDMDWSQKGAS